MAKYVGSWWIKDGIDGRRLEADGFASTLGGLSEFGWTQNNGECDVHESDFVTTTGATHRSDSVDADVITRLDRRVPRLGRQRHDKRAR